MESWLLTKLIAAGLLLVSGPARAGGVDVPIHVHGGDGQASECMTSRVSGLSLDGDNFLSVRSGPGGSYQELDRLRNGEIVTIFETRGKWVGVVYRTKNPDCFSPVTKPISFPKRGWISTKFLTDVAG